MIVLNMIVKDEADVIERCLNSVLGFIDAFVICDTGSTDNTIELILQWQRENNIPGKLVEHNWKNFEHNRNLALESCKDWISLEEIKEIKEKQEIKETEEKQEKQEKQENSYICFMDADDTLVWTDKSLCLNSDRVRIEMRFDKTRYNRRFLIKSDLVSSWEGVVHEYLKTEGPWTQARGAYVLVGTDGSRNKNPLKFLKDAYTLEEALETEPNNSRNLFYLAQSYRDFRDYNYYILAEKLYLQRAEILEYPEERYISFLEAAKCRLYRDKNNEKTLDLFMRAFSLRPQRLEAAYYIVKYFRTKKLYPMGYHFGKHLLEMKIPDEDNLFIDTEIYTWKFKDEVAICSFWTGDKTLYKDLYQKILKEDISEETRTRVKKDLSQFV